MNKRLTKISPNQTAWTIALWYFIVAVIAWIVWAIFSVARKGEGMSVLYGLIAVVLYPVVVYLAWLIGAWIYNGVARITGGIEFTLKDE